MLKSVLAVAAASCVAGTVAGQTFDLLFTTSSTTGITPAISGSVTFAPGAIDGSPSQTLSSGLGEITDLSILVDGGSFTETFTLADLAFGLVDATASVSSGTPTGIEAALFQGAINSNVTFDLGSPAGPGTQFIFFSFDGFSPPNQVIGTFAIVPTPSALGLCAMAGLFAARRRR